MNGFESQYVKLRKSEHRIYEDEEVKLLPDTDPTHIHYREWKYRDRSASKFIAWLLKKGSPLNILEIGCGNGWLSARLAKNPGFSVTGLDTNMVELEQAKRVFGENPQLKFICADFRDQNFPTSSFDIVLFAASMQYFPSFSDTITRVSTLLKPGGEVHILDTHFYPADKIVAARDRSSGYYLKAGVPEMAGHYFHHSVDELKNFEYRVLGGNNIIANALGIDSGLKWICINPVDKMYL